MRYKKIPGTDLEVSVISLGTWVFGGGEWGLTDEKQCLDAVDAAFECGINMIDTAPMYGAGLSEEIVGKAIKGKRGEVIIATKCGLIGTGKNIKISLKADSIRTEIEASLKRLRVEYIDIYQCHWPDRATAIEETMSEMRALKKEGKIRYIGVSNFDVALIKQALNCAEIATIQNHYSLLERSIEKDIIPFCAENKIGILSYGSLGGGILSGKYVKEPQFKNSDARSFFYRFYKGGEFERASKIVKGLRELSAGSKKPLNQIALNWINQKEAVVSAIAGSRNKEQSYANAFAAEWELSEEQMHNLDAMNLNPVRETGMC